MSNLSQCATLLFFPALITLQDSFEGVTTDAELFCRLPERHSCFHQCARLLLLFRCQPALRRCQFLPFRPQYNTIPLCKPPQRCIADSKTLSDFSEGDICPQ